MPIVIGIFFLLPLFLGAVLEYLCCRLPRRRFWRFLPPVVVILFLIVAVAVRLQTWESETVSPLTQLVIFPGVTGVALLLGIYLGWRFWKYLWSPKIIDDLPHS